MDQLNMLDLPAETISCHTCDAQEDGLGYALVHGWTEITYEPEGLDHNYLGRCPQCLEDKP